MFVGGSEWGWSEFVCVCVCVNVLTTRTVPTVNKVHRHSAGIMTVATDPGAGVCADRRAQAGDRWMAN